MISASPSFGKRPKKNLCAPCRAITVIRVHPTFFGGCAAGRFSKIDHADPPDETGWRTVYMRFQFDYEAVEALVGLGTYVKVLEPPDLRNIILTRARETVAFYEAMGRRRRGWGRINTFRKYVCVPCPKGTGLKTRRVSEGRLCIVVPEVRKAKTAGYDEPSS